MKNIGEFHAFNGKNDRADTCKVLIKSFLNDKKQKGSVMIRLRKPEILKIQLKIFYRSFYLWNKLSYFKGKIFLHLVLSEIEHGVVKHE